MPCSETAPTGALTPRKPPPSLPRDGRAGRECGFALTQPQSRPQRALECCANAGTARKATRSARCARLAGELLLGARARPCRVGNVAGHPEIARDSYLFADEYDSTTAVLLLVGRVKARIADADLVAKDSARWGPPGSPGGREGGSREFTHHMGRARETVRRVRPGSPRGLEHRLRSLLEGRKTIDDRRGAALPQKAEPHALARF